MIKSLSNRLRLEDILRKNERVVVGVSGGMDSMALLSLLKALNDEQGWHLDLHIAHVNHLLRDDESDEDAAFVQAAADAISLPCSIEQANIASLATESGLGLEESGRNVRYAFLEQIASRVGASAVAVAHHYEDQAETVLHRILRGTGLRGLCGIPAVRPIRTGSSIRLVRPLLHMRRSELAEFVADRGIAFREDSSNASTEPMRNRIRNEILPVLEDLINPQVKDAIVRLGEQAGWLTEYLGETVQRTFETLVISHTDQVLALNVDSMSRKSRIVQTELVRLAYRSFGLGEQELSFSHLVAVLDLISDPASGRSVQLPHDMTVSRHYHRLVFSLPSAEPREEIAEEVAVHLPGKTRLPIRRLEILCELEDEVGQNLAGLRERSSAFEEFVSYDAIRPPLVVRRRRPGDRFWPLGAPGSKKVAEFLSDAKVEMVDRDRIAVLCDQLGPIWIIGHRIDNRVKLTQRTRRVLHLTASPFGPESLT